MKRVRMGCWAANTCPAGCLVQAQRPHCANRSANLLSGNLTVFGQPQIRCQVNPMNALTFAYLARVVLTWR